MNCDGRYNLGTLEYTTTLSCILVRLFPDSQECVYTGGSALQSPALSIVSIRVDERSLPLCHMAALLLDQGARL